MSEKKEETPFIQIGEKEFAIKEIVLDSSPVLIEAYVNKSAVVKTDIKYLWNKFCQDSGGIENAVSMATKAMQDPSAFSDVSSIDQHDPLQSMVANEVRKKELADSIKKTAKQQSKSGESVEQSSVPVESSTLTQK